MSERPEQGLLDDVLAEAAPPDFRAALLGETLRQARRQRRWRQGRRAGGVLLALVLAAIFLRPSMLPEKISTVRPVAKTTAPKSYQLVETQPLPPGAVVLTKNFGAVRMVSSAATTVQIATSGGNFRVINDEQLLALVGAVPAVLIRTGPNSEELVFANPEDQKRLFGN